jgi:hypothetical protein
MNRKHQFIAGSDRPVAAALALTFTETSEQKTREAAHSKGRTYKSLSSAERCGFAERHLRPAIDTGVIEGLYAAASTDTTNSSNRLREEALKGAIKTYLAAA